MPPRSALNNVIIHSFMAFTLFALLAFLLPLKTLIVLLNGVFVGAAVSVLVAYRKLFWNSILGVLPYDRVRQMALGFALCWTAYVISVLASIYVRSTGGDPASLMIVAAGRYIAIIAAVLQITAPDFGLGLFHGRDRKMLFLSLGLGLFTAVVAIVVQVSEVLAF